MRGLLSMLCGFVWISASFAESSDKVLMKEARMGMRYRDALDVLDGSTVVVIGYCTGGTGTYSDREASIPLASIDFFRVDEVLSGSISTNEIYIIGFGPSRMDSPIVRKSHSYVLFLKSVSPEAREHYIDSSYSARFRNRFDAQIPAYWVLGNSSYVMDLNEDPNAGEDVRVLVAAHSEKDVNKKIGLLEKLAEKCKSKVIRMGASKRATSLRKDPDYEKKMKAFKEKVKKNRELSDKITAEREEDKKK